MANVPETAKVFNTPNYSGQLYTASPIETPFLTLVGGVGGNRALVTQNFEFATCSLYEHPDPAQPDISEEASLVAPAPYSYVRTQETNVTQIFHETISVSYDNLANHARLSGINTAGQQNNAPNELEFQTSRKLEKVARDIEYTLLNGTYRNTNASNVASRTRGMIAAAGTRLDAADAPLSKAMIDGIMKESWNNGAVFKEFFLFTNGSQKVAISEIYKEVTGFSLPPSRNVGGLNVTQIVTDFGNLYVVLNKFMPDNALLGAELSVVAPVEQPTPGKGNFFREELGKKGAAEEYQMFGKIGLDHGPAFMHFFIEGLEV